MLDVNRERYGDMGSQPHFAVVVAADAAYG